MLIKKRLMTPGPTQLSEATRLAMAAAHPHHRSKEFAAVLRDVLDGLRWLWDGDDVVVLAGSGTAGMEAAMRSVIAPTDRVAVVTGGKFAERWRTIAQKIGADVAVFDVPWGESAEPEAFAAWLAATGELDALVCVASETSTGALHPVAELASRFRAHARDGLVLVDGITAVGCADLSMRRDAIDLLVSGSQKAFGLPPGAAFVGVSARGWARMDAVDAPSYYFDLRRERKQAASGATAFTPAVPIVMGFAPVLADWRALGREGLFAHAEALAGATRAGVEALGYTLFPKHACSPALTSFEVPEAIGAAALRSALRTRYGLSIAGGQDQLADRVVRIGHLGAVDAFDVLQAISALAMATAALGGPAAHGRAIDAASAVLAPALAATSSVASSP